MPHARVRHVFRERRRGASNLLPNSVCYETRSTNSALEFLNIFSRLSGFIVFSCRHVVAIEVWGLGRIAVSHSRVSE
jgi:hypothetical protein